MQTQLVDISFVKLAAKSCEIFALCTLDKPKNFGSVEAPHLGKITSSLYIIDYHIPFV